MSQATQISWILGNKSPKIKQDLISNLEDFFISYILSCLPTKDAVRTSVLSKDWQYKWTCMHKFKLCDENLDSPNANKKPSFASFVERMFLLSPNLQSLDLHCYGEYDLLRWTTAALSRDVRSLSIKSNAILVLPPNLLTCYSLRKLEIDTNCTFKVPKKVCFPNLVALSLCRVNFSSERWYYNCVEFDLPLLEELQLELCVWLNTQFVEINAPKMTSLELFMPDFELSGNGDCSFQITGDNLVKFNWYEGCGIHGIVLSRSVHVVYAVMKHFLTRALLEKSGLQLRELLQGFSNLKDLELGYDVAEAIVQSNLGGLRLPTYHKMERLVLTPMFCTEVLLAFLHAAPYLKLLVVDVKNLKDYDYDAEEFVPSCIVSHLEHITFTSFTSGRISEIKLVKFFLKNAVQLKSLSIHPRLIVDRYVVIEELSTYPKASTFLNLTVK